MLYVVFTIRHDKDDLELNILHNRHYACLLLLSSPLKPKPEKPKKAIRTNRSLPLLQKGFSHARRSPIRAAHMPWLTTFQTHAIAEPPTIDAVMADAQRITQQTAALEIDSRLHETRSDTDQLRRGLQQHEA